jgi:hypothetical protein
MRGPYSTLLVLLASAFLQIGVARAQSPAEDERRREPATPADNAVPAAPPPPSRHLFAARLGVGMSFGGEAPLGRKVAAGDGITLQAGASLTPFWTSRIAFGGGIDFGYKYAATQSIGGGFSLSRIPLTVSAHALIRVIDGVFVRVAGGPHIEVDVQLSPTGEREAMDVGFHDALGFMAEGGMFYRGRHFAVDVSLRYTGLHYEGQTDRLADADASNIGMFLGVSYVL